MPRKTQDTNSQQAGSSSSSELAIVEEVKGGGLALPQEQINWDDYLQAGELDQIDAATSQNVDPSELIVPRLAMLQPLSPEIRDEIRGYNKGMIINNNTREVYSVNSTPPWLLNKGINPDQLEPVHFTRFVPIFKLPNEYMRWKKRNVEGKGWWWKTLNPHEVVDIRDNMMAGNPVMRAAGRGTFRGGWKPDANATSKAPPTTENLNFLGTVIDEDGEVLCPYIIATFAKTSFKAGTKFVSALQLHRSYRLPYFGKFYYLWSRYEKKGENAYYVLESVPGGYTPANTKLISMCTEMARYLADKEHGIVRQEAMISNAVEFEDEDPDEFSGSAGEGGYIPPETGGYGGSQQGGGQQGNQPLSGEPVF